MKFQKFMPLAKMEEQTDGTLNVFGIVTGEVPDLDKEVCDYEGTKPLYQQRTMERIAITSKVEGMTPSLMPMRGQHNPGVAEGAGRAMVLDDAAKTIKMGFHVVDAEAVKKWKAGVYVGFSQGGTYVKRWPDPVFEGCTRYIADPMEVSAVDAPCLTIALVESMKGRTVSLAKSAGTTEQIALVIPTPDNLRLEKMERELHTLTELLKEKKTKTVDGVELTASCFAHVGDPEDTSTWKLPIKFPGDDEKTKSHIRNALARFEQTEGMSADEKAKAKKKIVAAAKEHGIEVSEADKAAITRACAKISLVKGMYEVGWLASFIEDLHWLCLQSEFERDMEDDGSKVPEGLREAWMALLVEFKAMAIEEADEMAAQGGKGEKGMKITDQAGLTKAAKTIHDHLEKLSEMHKAHGEHMEKAHEAMQAKHEQLGEHIEKCMKAAKDSMEGEEPEKVAPSGDANKAVTDELAELKKSLAELTAKLATTPANPAPATGVPELVGKSATVSADFAELLK